MPLSVLVPTILLSSTSGSDSGLILTLFERLQLGSLTQPHMQSKPSCLYDFFNFSTFFSFLSKAIKMRFLG